MWVVGRWYRRWSGGSELAVGRFVGYVASNRRQSRIESGDVARDFQGNNLEVVVNLGTM